MSWMTCKERVWKLIKKESENHNNLERHKLSLSYWENKLDLTVSRTLPTNIYNFFKDSALLLLLICRHGIIFQNERLNIYSNFENTS